MGTFSIWHWIIVLIIVALVFGTKKLRNLGSDLGSDIRGFKDGMKESETEKSSQPEQAVIEVAAMKDATFHTPKENNTGTVSGKNASQQTPGSVTDTDIRDTTNSKT